MERAARLICRLASTAIWSLTITNDVDADGICGVLNVFTSSKGQRAVTRHLFGLACVPPDDHSDEFETYKIDSLMVSIIEGDTDARSTRPHKSPETEGQAL